MPRRHKNTNPYPRLISDRLWLLIHAWAEWRSCKGTPRALPMPEETGKCHIRNGCVIFEPVGAVLEPHSTRPPEVSTVEELNHCMAKLGETERECLVVVAAHQSQPWLKGIVWRRWMAGKGLTRRDFQRRLKLALKALAEVVKGRGLA